MKMFNVVEKSAKSNFVQFSICSFSHVCMNESMTFNRSILIEFHYPQSDWHCHHHHLDRQNPPFEIHVLEISHLFALMSFYIHIHTRPYRT
mmetsp:Transcript_17582/g.21491  ORF Transcript_17582/g.21491 Transcript_17582/m.21491 type:complete len:91 (+) Transcript_17582:146-418(+)